MDTPPLSLAACKSGAAYRVVAIRGGPGLELRLRHLGLSQGQTLRKRSGQFFRGPVVIRVQSTELAIGHRMASSIFVEPVHETSGADRQPERR